MEVAPIIVKFNDFETKTKFIKASKKAKIQDPYPIFCDEHLTQATKKTLLACKKAEERWICEVCMGAGWQDSSKD